MLLIQIGAAILLILASVGGLLIGRQQLSPSGMRRYFWLMLGYGAILIVHALNTDPVLEWALLGLQLATVTGIVITVARLVRQKKAHSL